LGGRARTSVTGRQEASSGDQGTDFLPEALILIRLPSSLRTVMSVDSVRMPTLTFLVASWSELNERSSTASVRTSALSDRPRKSKTSGCESESGRPE
jgi:hypothetical protein